MCAGLAEPRGAASDDDVWGDNDDAEGAEREELSREWQTRRQQYWNSGYREGMDEGKGETVQQGFDRGYAEGVAAGLAWGQAHGAAKTLNALLARAPSLAAHASEVEAVASDMERPLKSIMLVTTAHILESDPRRGSKMPGQQDAAEPVSAEGAEGPGAGTGAPRGAASTSAQPSGAASAAQAPAGTVTAAELEQAQRRAEGLLRDLGIRPVAVDGQNKQSPEVEQT